jgi:beta-lactamase class A
MTGKLTHIIKNRWTTYLACVALGLIVGLVIHFSANGNTALLESTPIRIPDRSLPFISPLLTYDTAEATNFGQLVSFKENISKLINEEVKKNNAKAVSVYYRDLNTGRWFAINKDESYVPASLMKVPLMIAYYKLAEKDPGLLSTQIFFDGKNDIDNEQTIQPSQRLQVGVSYTVDEMIDEMIMYSDNDAMQILLSRIDPNILDQEYKDMRIILPEAGDVKDFIHVNNYALFFRVLYGGTYLSHSNSEKALELLGKSVYKDGLVSGVPKDTIVAHKFGEYSLIDPVTRKASGPEFHDCGVVYDTESPYILCLMSKGDDLKKLESTIKDVSALVYTEVNKKEN